MGRDPLVSGSKSKYTALRPTGELVKTHCGVGPNQGTIPSDPLVSGSRPTGEWVQENGPPPSDPLVNGSKPTGEWVQEK